MLTRGNTRSSKICLKMQWIAGELKIFLSAKSEKGMAHTKFGFLLFAFLSFILCSGCLDRPQNGLLLFKNESDTSIWIDQATIGKADYSCGVLGPGSSASRNLPPIESSNDSINIVWWYGNNRNRPEDESKIFNSKISLNDLNVKSTTSNMQMRFTKNRQWQISD